MRIVYTLTSNLVCGGHIIVLQHATRLAERGHTVYICVLDETIPATKTSFSWFPNFDCNVVHPINFPKSIDICVATFWDTVIQVLKFPANHKVYFVQSDETRFYDDPIIQNWVVLTYLCNIHYITEAKWIVDWLKNNFGHQAAYIPNALDPKIIYPDEPVAVKRDDKLRILIEGTIDSPFKRVKEAIEASQGLGCEIWCVSNGGKPEPNWSIDRFFYKVNFDQMRNIYSSCDILLKLSSVEGFFGPPLEMMACGGVCVVSDVTGYDEYIKHEYNALVVPNGDINLARQSLLRLINDQNLYKKLQQNGLLTSSLMRWDNSIDKLEAFYQQLANQPQSFHIKAERIETLRHLLSNYSLSAKLSKFLNAYEPSNFELFIASIAIKFTKKFKYIFTASIRRSISKKLFKLDKT